MWKYKKETVRIEIVYLIHIPYLEEGHLLIFHLEWGGSSLFQNSFFHKRENRNMTSGTFYLPPSPHDVVCPLGISDIKVRYLKIHQVADTSVIINGQI